LLEALCAEIFNKDLEPNFLKGEFLFKNKNSPLGSNKNSPLGQISPLGRKGDPLSWNLLSFCFSFLGVDSEYTLIIRDNAKVAQLVKVLSVKRGRQFGSSSNSKNSDFKSTSKFGKTEKQIQLD